jgi:alpha-methylacyl-CoA racemase
MSGPLSGVRVLELRGIGPLPFAGMLLSDLGADVVRIDRVAGPEDQPPDPAEDSPGRGRRSIALNLKEPAAAEVVLRLCAHADVLIEGFRPGVAERLGVGPQPCLARNERLVYGRMTGWGQDGPLSHSAGHDINYIALAGVLHGIGRAGQPPVPPLNLIGDYGGGGLLLAFGVVCGLLEARSSGRGQVVDAAMVDGAALFTTVLHELIAGGGWTERRGENILDGGTPWYDCYETADGRYVAVGALEQRFYDELTRLTGVDLPRETMDPTELRDRLGALFRQRTQREWCELLDGTDACCAPVLAPTEAPRHPHNHARHSYITVDGIVQPAPAPRFSRTPGAVSRPPARAGAHTREVLAERGFTAVEISDLLENGAAGQWPGKNADAGR